MAAAACDVPFIQQDSDIRPSQRSRLPLVGDQVSHLLAVSPGSPEAAESCSPGLRRADTSSHHAGTRMADPWERGTHIMMAGNVLLLLATLAVGVALFTQTPAPPPSCPPVQEVTSPGDPDPGDAVPSPSPPAGSDVMIRKLVKQAVEERVQAYQDAEYFRTKTPTGRKAFAHVVLGNWQNNSRDADLLWDPRHQMSLLQDVDYLQEGYLRVNGSGFYFVFLSLHYMERPGHGFDRDRLKDYIYRTDPRSLNKEEFPKKVTKQLLFNKQTPCRVVPGAVPLASSYQGAVVYLHRGDLLSVRSSLPDTLHPESARSYFGLYLV